MDYPLLKALDHLEAFSADVIASLTLAEKYDLKSIAYDIELVLSELNLIQKEPKL